MILGSRLGDPPDVGYTWRVTWQTADELLAWLGELPPAEAVRVARLLADTRTAGVLREYADEIVYTATRTAKSAEVEAALGLSRKQVMKAVERRLAARRAAA